MHIARVTPLLVGPALASWFWHGTVIAASQSIILAENGETNYVLTGHPDESDLELALEELAAHLEAATGTDFRSAACG